MTPLILSIIIVNWNTGDYLKWCLRYIYKRTRGINFEVLVVDNASPDGSADMVQSDFPYVKLIRNQTNLGFARANNQAIRQARGKYILLLNADTKVTEQALVKMVDFMEQNSQVGILGCRLLNPDGSLQPSCRQFPSLLAQMIILLKLHNLFPRLKTIRNYYLLDWPHNTIRQVDQVMGACFLVRHNIFTKIGLLDEHYFIWFEEVDFCQRALRAGWPTYFFPEAEVYHEKGASFNQILSPKKQYWFNKSGLRYFRLHHSFFSFMVLLSLSPFSILLAMITQLFFWLKPLQKKKYL